MEEIAKVKDQEDSISYIVQEMNLEEKSDQNQWNSGHWSEEENLKCVVYFEFNKAHLHSKLKIK